MLGNAKSYIATVSRRAEIAKDMGLAHALSDVVASLHTIMTTRGSVVRLLVPAAAGYVLRVPIIAVRKAKDFAKGDSSSVNAVLPHRPLRYAIVDDFVSSGETVNRIATQVRDKYPALQLAAILLHEQNSATTAGK